jgi:hypothetical protein
MGARSQIFNRAQSSSTPHLTFSAESRPDCRIAKPSDKAYETNLLAFSEISAQASLRRALKKITASISTGTAIIKPTMGKSAKLVIPKIIPTMSRTIPTLKFENRSNLQLLASIINSPLFLYPMPI